jgi:hypothetical protein
VRSPPDIRQRRPLARSAARARAAEPQTTVVSITRLDAWRQERAELPPGPDVCPPWCEWCYAPNWLAGWWSQ